MTTGDEDFDGSIKITADGTHESQTPLLSSAENTPNLTRDSSPGGFRSPRPGVERQSSLSHPRPNGTPRTTNRVRFNIDDQQDGRPLEDWTDDEDYLNSPSQHAPLLTDITPPTESPFRSNAFQPEDYLPDARPKSGMRSAFMNMANSIIGAGIIGQPYAFRQAGLTMGVILLVGLTITVDWTIRLIVVNSKLSGADSFQATMQHCFGKSGLIAISVAQWAFAFGGMIAFCIIVGDTIPHVLEALIPGLRDVPFLWLLTDRRAVIVLFVLGVSWPLSLYRDIAKVRLEVINIQGNAANVHSFPKHLRWH
jgi:sodium-coupled neutral amino acid transporter 11